MDLELLVDFAPAMLRTCDNTFRSRGMIAPNIVIVSAIVFKHPILAVRVVEHYQEVLEGDVLKLEDRHRLLDAMAVHYMRRPWPIDASDHEITTFSDELHYIASMNYWVFD